MAASAAMYSNTTESQYIASSTVQFYARKIRSDLSDRIGGGSGRQSATVDVIVLAVIALIVCHLRNWLDPTLAS
jgi:hypothetical protein